LLGNAFDANKSLENIVIDGMPQHRAWNNRHVVDCGFDSLKDFSTLLRAAGKDFPTEEKNGIFCTVLAHETVKSWKFGTLSFQNVFLL
jgi:hypothetical protein